MRFIFLIVVMISVVFSFNKNFLPAEKAFVIEKKEDTIYVNLGKDIYIYKDKFKVFYKDKDITKEISLPKASKFHDFLVFDKSFSFKTNYNEITIKYQGCSKQGICYPPIEKQFKLEIPEEFNKSFIMVLVSFFGFGLLLSLTPCIFPMIPILSGLIISANKKEKLSTKKSFMLSLVYVLSMSVAYTIAGVLAGVFGANLQSAMQNPIVIGIFSLIFVLLAFSLFGFYSIELPKSIQTKINNISSKQTGGNFIGVSIMGFLSALIVGPCVAPPLAGALIYIGQTGDAFLGGSALFMLSLGMGVPLLLIGLGAKFLPKAGSWMENISRVFGIIMIILAIFMLDRILDESIIIWLYIITFIGSIIYLNRYLKHIIFKIFYILVVSYTLLLVYKVTQNDYSMYPYIKKDSSDFIITDIKNIDNIVKNNKLVLIDIWAKWCISCKELEETFNNKEIKELLKNYKLIKIDITNNTKEDKEFLSKFNLFGPPAILIYKNNKLVHKIIGYKTPKELKMYIKGL